MGEPWIFGLLPQHGAQFLSDRGLFLQRDGSANEYRKLHYGKAADDMKGYEFYHTVLATKV